MYYLAIQSTYTHIQIALINNTSIIGVQSIDKIEASKFFIVTLQRILSDHNLPFGAIDFIAVNRGPAPFTTLRVVIASVNGLNCAIKKPLIGIDAFDAYLHEYKQDNVLVLFNAFGKEVYYALKKNNSLEKGVSALGPLIEKIKKLPEKFLIVGNGSTIYRKELTELLGDKAHIPDDAPDYCSIESIAQLGLIQWHKTHCDEAPLQPLYLKQHMG